MKLFADDAVISVTVCLKSGGWQSGVGTWKEKNQVEGSSSNIQRERPWSWRSSWWRQRWLQRHNLQNCADRGQPKSRRRGQRHGGRAGEAAQAWKTMLVILHTDGQTVRSHHSFPLAVDELFDGVFLVHKPERPLSRKSTNLYWSSSHLQMYDQNKPLHHG